MAVLVSKKRGKSRRGPAADPTIYAAIKAQVDSARAHGDPVSPVAIHRQIKGQFGESNVPSSINTIKDLIEEILKLEPSQPWTFESAEPDDIAIIAPVWAGVLEHGARLTKGQAACIVRVRSAAPDLPPEDAWAIATIYDAGQLFGHDVRYALDALLAFRPWCDPAHAERYFGAANSGRIPSPPMTWDLALRAIRNRPASESPEAFAFFESLPKVTLTLREDRESWDISIEPRKPRKARKGRKAQ